MKFKNLKIRIVVVSFSTMFLFSSCAIKKNDSTSEKVLKHTVNSPIYVGMIAEQALILTIGGVGAAIHKTKDSIIGADKKNINANEIIDEN